MFFLPSFSLFYIPLFLCEVLGPVLQMECMTGEERLVTEQLEKRTVAPSDSDPQRHGSVAETLEAAAQTHPSALAPEVEEHINDVCSELTNVGAYLGAIGGVRMEVETCPTQMETESELWDVNGLEPPYPEEPKYISRATVRLLLHSCLHFS